MASTGNKQRDIDGVSGRILERFESIGSEHHVLVFGELKPFNHLRALYKLVVIDGYVLLLDSRAIFLAQQMKRDALGGNGC